MQCVNSAYRTEQVIKKSRFIGYLQPCSCEADIARKLEQLQNQHPHANHIAFAYRVHTTKGLAIRCHDAGEPSGTAGKPILQHLDGRELINVLVAVVRYFGGIKLGAGGLTRAYGNTAKKLIETADIIDYIEFETLGFKLDYAQMRLFEYQLKTLKGIIINQDFSDYINLVVSIPASNAHTLKQLFPC